MRFIYTATRESDDWRLHLLNRGTEYEPWTICWNYDEKHKCWDWGIYVNSLSEALLIFIEKYVYYGFNSVVEGYAERQN